MRCTRHGCGGALRVSHSYPVGSERFQRAVCEECGTIHRMTTTAAPVSARGEGARAYAARAKRALACDPSERPSSAPS